MPHANASAGGPPVHRRLKRFHFTADTCVNFQFATWLREWYEEAAARDSRLQFAYRKVSHCPARCVFIPN